MKVWVKFNAGFQLCPPDFNFAPPPPISRSWRRPWHNVADITEFHIDFLFMVYIDRWQPWHAEFEKFMLFRYFSIFGFMCVHSQPTKIIFVDRKYKNGKQIIY